MRFLILLFLSFLCLSCKNEPINPDFIVGNWKRINEDSTKTTFEIWKSDLSGVGYTLKNNDTIFKEVLSIISSDGKQYFQVTGVNQQPTLFLITKLTKNSLVSENKENDFPKEISYWLENDTLKAKVGNEDFAIDFEFERIKEE
jgi:hypothetical protein